ncbi:unnamed protein product [Durusdinium trenchii]|uniref:Uncharacterized protein n=2 Tax=Durusdinium trenchii TaxID=1381693 RepID=A0ABP0IWW8_9DINO
MDIRRTRSEATASDLLQVCSSMAACKRTLLAVSVRLWYVASCLSKQMRQTIANASKDLWAPRSLCQRCWTSWAAFAVSQRGEKKLLSLKPQEDPDVHSEEQRDKALIRHHLDLMFQNYEVLQLQQAFRHWSHASGCQRRWTLQRTATEKQQRAERAWEESQWRQQEANRKREEWELWLHQRASELQDLQQSMDQFREEQRLRGSRLREAVSRCFASTTEQLRLLFAWCNWRSMSKRRHELSLSQLTMKLLILQILGAWATWTTSSLRGRRFEEHLECLAQQQRETATSLLRRGLRRLEGCCLEAAFHGWLRHTQHTALSLDEIVGSRAPMANESGSHVADLLQAAASVLEERLLWFWEPLLSALMLFWYNLAQASKLHFELQKQSQEQLDLEYQQSLQRFQELQDIESKQYRAGRHARSCVMRLVSDVNFYLLEVVLCAWKIQAESRQGGFPLPTPASAAGWHFGEGSPRLGRSPWPETLPPWP